MNIPRTVDISNNVISNEERLLINILNTMYNDNVRQINNLSESNEQIRVTITNLLLNNSNNLNSRSDRSNRRNNSGNLNNYIRNYYSVNNNSSRVTPDISNNLYNYDYYDNSYVSSVNPITQLINNINNRSNISNNYSVGNFFDPILIYPSQYQIDISIRNVRFSDIISPRNTSCPISLEPFNDNDTVSVIRFCGHVFNRMQLTTWFRTNCRCPVCRYDIRNYNRNNNTNNNTNDNIENTRSFISQNGESVIDENENAPENVNENYYQDETHEINNTESNVERNLNVNNSRNITRENLTNLYSYLLDNETLFIELFYPVSRTNNTNNLFQ